MVVTDLSPLFAGANDERLLFALRRRIHNPRNDAQRTFCHASDAIEYVNSDGFEMLLEQVTPFEHYAMALSRLGLPQVQPIFSKVLALIPPELRPRDQEEALFKHLRGHFQELKMLSYEFYDACSDYASIAARYVCEHQGEFHEYV